MRSLRKFRVNLYRRTPLLIDAIDAIGAIGPVILLVHSIDAADVLDALRHADPVDAADAIDSTDATDSTGGIVATGAIVFRWQVFEDDNPPVVGVIPLEAGDQGVLFNREKKVSASVARFRFRKTNAYSMRRDAVQDPHTSYGKRNARVMPSKSRTYRMDVLYGM